MRKLIKRITIGIFVTFISIFGILTFLFPDQTFSPNENRNLASFPTIAWDELSLASLGSHEFTSDFETYFTDQFAFRDQWVVCKAAMIRATGGIENNGVFFGNHHQLIQQNMSYDADLLTKSMASVNTFVEKIDLPTTFLVVPGASLGSGNLPNLAYTLDETEVIQTMQEEATSFTVVDPTQAFQRYTQTHPEEPLYFLTDHHWNAQGAYLGYQTLLEAWSMEPLEFAMTPVSDSFRGTLYSKSGAYWTPKDTIVRMDPPMDLTVTMTLEGSEEKDSLFCENRLQEKDQYTYYLDGNHGIVEIETNSSNPETLLVIKDSFAHIMMPYLAPHFSRIIMVDLRYYRMPLTDLIAQEGVDRVLFLYSVDNLITDTNLGLLR